MAETRDGTDMTSPPAHSATFRTALIVVACLLLVTGLAIAGWTAYMALVPRAAPPAPAPPPVSPTPTPRESPAAAFPDATTTGVPDGLTLGRYRGPCTITQAGTVLDALRVTCSPLVIEAKNVRITRSQVGPVAVDGLDLSVSITDSTVLAGNYVGPAVGFNNVTIRGTEIRGGQHSVLCAGSCLIERSWLHDQSLPEGEDRHNNAVLSNGGSKIVVRGNTVQCTPPDNDAGGGCSGDISLFGDFLPVSDVTIEGNLIKATPGAFCVRLGHDPGKKFGEETTGIVVRNNVFEGGPGGQCGANGPVTSAPSDLTWQANRYADGTPIDPS